MPIPKHTLHTVLRWFSPAAERTIRKTATASGPPNLHSLMNSSNGRMKERRTLKTKFVTMMNTTNRRKSLRGRFECSNYKPGPRCLTIFSLAASAALVDEAGYSPPTPYGSPLSSEMFWFFLQILYSQCLWFRWSRQHQQLTVDQRLLNKYRANVKNQNSPCTLPPAPWAAVPKVAPRTINSVVITSAAFLPILSQITPTTICPRIAPWEKSVSATALELENLEDSPTRSELETRVETFAVYSVG